MVRRTLLLAQRDACPVAICYMGSDGITQRTVYVRKTDEEKLTAYCTQKRGVRVFKLDGILSAQIVDTGKA